MPFDLQHAAPTDSNGDPFVGAVDPATGILHPFEGGTTTSIAGSPSGASTIRPVIEVAGLVVAGSNTALSSPPGTTNVGSDTALTFSALVNHWCLQNNSGATLYYNLDAAASTGTFALAPGGQVWWDWPCAVVHIYTAAAINVNGASGLMLIGRV